MHGNVKKAEFRNKKYGWHYFCMHIESDKKNYYKRLDEDFYLKLFLDNTILRPICYDCPLKRSGSRADITLADCWNSEKITEKIVDTDEGLSLMIANTEKGKTFIEALRTTEKATLLKADTQKALESQKTLKISVKPNPNRSVFFEKLKKEHLKDLMKSWYHLPKSKLFHMRYIFIKTKIKFKIQKL